MSADDSDAEFEDAVDTLDPVATTSAAATPAEKRVAIPLTPSHPIIPKLPLLETPRPSTSNATVAAAAAAASSSHQRRNRLAVLRGRIVTEFGTGGSPVGTSTCGSGTASIAGDDLSSAPASETASLQSWGRNLLMEQAMDRSVIAVYPADTISTHAATTFGHFTSHHHVHPLPDFSPINEDPVARTHTNPPCSPPPTQPPPPLPSDVSPPPRPVPPPLPPRRINGTSTPAVRLPVAIPQRETIKPTDVTPRVVEELKQQAAAELDTSSSDSYGKRRGHAKSNSLDRGLSLAKAMKSGPFPPPSSKSNSLNRSQCNPSELMAIAKCEDDERNVDAEGVIHQLTQSVLYLSADDDESQGSKDNLSDDTRKHVSQTRSHPLQHVLLAAVGEEASTTTSSPASSCAKTQNTVPHYENIAVESEIANEEMLPSTSKAAKLTPVPEVPKKTRSLDRKDKTDTLGLDLVDPITRDVQRRMSMKTNGVDRTTDDGTVSTNSQTPASLRLAQTTRTLFRSYGSLANDLFRKGLSKARAVVAAGTSPRAGGRGRLSNNDGLGGVSDEEEDVDDCVSSNCSPQHSCKKESINASPSPRIPTPICRPKNVKKGPLDFSQLRIMQELTNEHTGAVWCIKFSLCGRLMATAGQDNIVRVWVLRDQFNYFARMRDRYAQQTNQRIAAGGSAVLQTATMMNELEESFRTMSSEDDNRSEDKFSMASGASNPHQTCLFAPQPFTTYRGHTSDILDLSWSRSYFLLSSGMDRTVKLWHLSRRECLCCFQHVDFVTCVAFMPKDDRYFLSGSLDGKLRMWHIPDKKVALWNEVEGVKFITAITFVKNGRFAAVGTYNGRCYFYSTDQLKYHTVIDVRSSRGKNARGGNKITGLAVHGDKLLVTSNDSRIRMYDLRDMDIICKFKGIQNEHSQIRASFSPDGRHVICGSEDRHIYLWKTSDSQTGLSVRKDRNAMWERVRGHGSIVSAAIFAPKPQLFLNILEAQQIDLPLISDRVEKNSPGSKNPPLVVATNPTPTRAERSLTIGSSHSALSTAQLPHPTSVTHQMSIGGTQYGKTTLHGDVIVSADLGGTVKIMVNPDRSKTGSSNMAADF
ncbi:hypothetical protein QR680_016554 [Steinernema hermaphroditum]|uniref:WD repeat-containing protein 44 n=1 Tax=Steinernema hermaphroditum TaxID=289476 RepID=A0AA39HBK7_9BILA|nr:hypothetical protein QR680_016554 [Steinernema hermaphroditum]